MLTELSKILTFVIDAFLRMWPFLLITIPIAVAVNMSGASKYINRAFQNRPVVAILLATLVGAFSPFCSCGVIPIVASLLISGVPLAPVMAFWIASPSMDPEAFFLSVATIGWELAIWRLAGTLVVSLAAGFITHFVTQRGWLGTDILRARQAPEVLSLLELGKKAWIWIKATLTPVPQMTLAVGSAGAAASTGPVSEIMLVDSWTSGVPAAEEAATCTTCSPAPARPSFGHRLLVETRDAAWLVIKFMALAFFLEALIELYVPTAWIVSLLGDQNPWVIPAAALLGVPVYTSNLAALPMISGLLAQGMSPAAALAFLIAGPTTTLPAMSAVYGLVNRRVFALYISFALFGAVVLGYAYALSRLMF